MVSLALVSETLVRRRAADRDSQGSESAAFTLERARVQAKESKGWGQSLFGV